MRSLWWKFKCVPVSHIKKDGGPRLLRQFLTLPVGQCQARHAAQRGAWRLSSGRAGDRFESHELGSSRFFRDQFDMTAWLARSSSPLGTTTHSLELGNFPLCAKRPRTGGLWRRCCGLWRDQFRRGGDFGRVVSALEIRLPGNGDRCQARDAVRMSDDYLLKPSIRC